MRSVRPTLVDVDSAGGDVAFTGRSRTQSAPRRSSLAGATCSRPTTATWSAPAATSRWSARNILDIETPAGSVGDPGTRVNIDVVDAANMPSGTTVRSVLANAATDTIFLGRHQFFTGELVQYTTAGTAIGGLVTASYYR